ncbi:MAG: hypothetical protein EPN56_07715 [Rhodanobacter sp.]|nr:MAG: hypothetical protein EPN66_11610 [Rhodanobacter sp.]TAM35948.1 MAG: hypothetical protein EPN56_07715 [Rhodanobacter sp.]
MGSFIHKAKPSSTPSRAPTRTPAAEWACIGTDGIGFYTEASVGKGKAHSNSSTHADTVVSAADTLSLTAGHDATIQGTQAKGDTVLTDVGHDLTITGEQDTGDYANTQWQVGGKVVVGMQEMNPTPFSLAASTVLRPWTIKPSSPLT